MIGVRIAALGLVLAVLCASQQACAFGLRLGPFVLGGRVHHHHHRHFVRRPTEALPSEATPTYKIARQTFCILSWPGLRLPMTFSGRPTIPPGRSATKAFSIRPSPNIPPSVSLTCAPAGSG